MRQKTAVTEQQKEVLQTLTGYDPNPYELQFQTSNFRPNKLHRLRQLQNNCHLWQRFLALIRSAIPIRRWRQRSRPLVDIFAP